MEVEGKEMVAEGSAMLADERTGVLGEGGEIRYFGERGVGNVLGKVDIHVALFSRSPRFSVGEKHWPCISRGILMGEGQNDH